MTFSNALKFEALLVAAAEVLPYAKDEFLAAAMSNLEGMNRKQRRAEERAFHEGFANLHRILTKFSTIVEHDNPGFFNRMVDTLVSIVNDDNLLQWEQTTTTP